MLNAYHSLAYLFHYLFLALLSPLQTMWLYQVWGKMLYLPGMAPMLCDKCWQVSKFVPQTYDAGPHTYTVLMC